MAAADVIKLLITAITALCGVIVFLFTRLEAATKRADALSKQLYDDARQDAATDKDIADSLRIMTGLMQQPRTFGGGNNGNG